MAPKWLNRTSPSFNLHRIFLEHLLCTDIFLVLLAMSVNQMTKISALYRAPILIERRGEIKHETWKGIVREMVISAMEKDEEEGVRKKMAAGALPGRWYLDKDLLEGSEWGIRIPGVGLGWMGWCDRPTKGRDSGEGRGQLLWDGGTLQHGLTWKTCGNTGCAQTPRVSNSEMCASSKVASVTGPGKTLLRSSEAVQRLWLSLLVMWMLFAGLEHRGNRLSWCCWESTVGDRAEGEPMSALL